MNETLQNHVEHDAREIANWFIINGDFLTPLQIIKLVYMSHGWMLGLQDRPLFRQDVEAWKYGPVIPDVYHELKIYGNSPVEKPIKGVVKVNLEDIELDLIQQVNRLYGGFSGIRLSQITHADGSPWHQIWMKHKRSAIIPNELIKDYYRNLAEKRRESNE